MKIAPLFILILSLLLTNCSPKITPSTTEAQVPSETIKKKKVFLLAGQSNMEGRADGGKLTIEDKARLEKAGQNVTLFYNRQPVTPLQLSTPKKYIQKKFGLEYNFGPEVFFGINLAEKYPDEEFIFIKRSQGGTSLYGCWNPNWTEEKATQMRELKKPKLYFDFIAYAKEVLTNYDSSEYEIAGMLWVQGESDSGTKNGKGTEPSETYGENLRNLIAGVRKEFNKPDLPFMLFQVGGGKVVTGMKETAAGDEHVFLIPQSKDKNSPDYYPKNPAPLGHYVTESMKRIGERFFEVYERTKED